MTCPEPCWLAHVERRVRRWTAPGGATWLVAVSGGGDSVALLRLLHAIAPRVGLRLIVAHLDHGARGAASRADAAFVVALAGSLGLPVVAGTWAPERPNHFEADARRARLAFLSDAARQHGATAVVLGHTRDDQAETLLHRIVRGTGLRGLAGIPARRRLVDGVTLARPLLQVSRADLRAYLETLGQPYRDDPTNADPAQTRARLRHEILPQLAARLNPDAAGALARLAQQAAGAWSALAPRVRRLLRRAVVSLTPTRIVLNREALRRESPFVRREALRGAWRRAGWPEQGMDARRWRRLDALTGARHDAGPLDIGHGIRARVAGPQLLLERPVSTPLVPPPPQTLPVPGVVTWPGGRLIALADPRSDVAPSSPPPFPPETGGRVSEAVAEWIDADSLVGPLRVRAVVPGDRVDPLGLGGRTQAVKNLLRRADVPPERRAVVPLVCDDRGIVWLVGHRIADRVKQTAATTRLIGLRWEPDPA